MNATANNLKHADNDAEKIHEMSDEEADDLGDARSSRAHI